MKPWIELCKPLFRENCESLRVSFGVGTGDGWFLLRMSLHDLQLPLNSERLSMGGVHPIAETLVAFLSGYEKLETSGLKGL